MSETQKEKGLKEKYGRSLGLDSGPVARLIKDDRTGNSNHAEQCTRACIGMQQGVLHPLALNFKLRLQLLFLSFSEESSRRNENY